jgi:hypothetical protein
MAALPAALSRLLPFFGGLEAVGAVPLILAHLALAPAAILARAADDMRRRRFFTAIGIGKSLPVVIESIWPCSFSICSLMATML